MEERKERREGKGKRVREGREKKREGRGLLPLTSFTLKSSLLVYTLFLEVRFPRKSKIQQEAQKRSWSLFRCKRSHRKSQAKRPNHKHTSRSCLYGYYISRVPSKLVQQII